MATLEVHRFRSKSTSSSIHFQVPKYLVNVALHHTSALNMPRTVTRHLQSFRRPDATFAFKSGPEAHVTTITIPPGSRWTSEPHWHLDHTEFLNIKQGTALVTLGSKTQSLTSAAGQIIVERGVIHEWRRDSDVDDGPLVVEEWTDPADGDKELFFRNLCSSIQDMTANPSRAPPPLGLPLDWWIWWQLLLIFREFDNYPVLHYRIGSGLTTYIVLGLAHLLGGIVGLKSWYKEYTPGKGNVNAKED